MLSAMALPGTTTLQAADAESAAVWVNSEELHGQWAGKNNRIAAFLGVPFAAAPLGDLRWRAPRPLRPRPGPQPAVDFAPACIQGSSGVDWYVAVAAAFGHGPEAVGRPNGFSEDCLYLNVWSPQLDDKAGLPVMVFVHGGSNSGGWSYEPNYIGARLAERGVVVVTIAYRLGPFGFFSHPALVNEDNEPVANFALLDIEAAFAWVRKHIQAFGGDPDELTAFGESSGALDIVDLLVADLAAQRVGGSGFRRLISQSLGGSLNGRQTLAEEQAVGEQLISYLDIEGDITAAKLRGIPADDLLAAAERLPADHYFDAVIDGRTLIAQPIDTLRRASMAGVNIIAGTNADEWLMYVSKDPRSSDLETWITENAPEHRERLLEVVGDETDIRRVLDRMRTAKSMLCPSRFLAKRANEGGGRGWVYYFTRQRPGPGGEKLGAYHGTELPYVFNQHDDWLPVDREDRVLTEAVLDFWVQFARTGDPNVEGRPGWPVHSLDDPTVMELGIQIGPMAPMDPELCEMLGPVPEGRKVE